ncbi:MAG: AAA family ATPase, partial [Verrucomicrobiales bacterium]|nr:AAA family ATPase [Verrucomicrobiales bacterium]
MSGSNLESLREALKHSPENVPLLLLYGQGCLDEWSMEEARVAYERVLAVEPVNTDAKLGVARVLFLVGKTSEAVIRAEQLVVESPGCARGLVLLSRLYLAEGNKELATETYGRALSIDPNSRDDALAQDLGQGGEGSGDNGRGEEKRALRDSGAGWEVEDDEGEDEFGESIFMDDAGEDAEPGAKQKEKYLSERERPKIKFEDVGGMGDLKEQIRMKILYPLENPDLFKAYGKKMGGGVLLYGPPGCGKTLISRATAGEIKASFFPIGIHEVLDSYIGESEKNLARIFQMARDNAPSVLFFDEVDALAADRRDMRGSLARNVINQFLEEMDNGEDANEGVLVLGATNAPWHIDPAFRRPGRFDRTIFVPPPDEVARRSIVDIMAKGKPVAGLDAGLLAKKTRGFSGADIKLVFDMATEAALEKAMKQGRVVPIETKGLLKVAKTVNL